MCIGMCVGIGMGVGVGMGMGMYIYVMTDIHTYLKRGRDNCLYIYMHIGPTVSIYVIQYVFACLH